MAKYRMKSVRSDESICMLDGSLADVKDYIEGLIEKYGQDAYMEVESYGYDCYPELIISHERQETDAERDKRLAQARKEREKKKAEKLKQEEREHKELARLQKKYGES